MIISFEKIQTTNNYYDCFLPYCPEILPLHCRSAIFFKIDDGTIIFYGKVPHEYDANLNLSVQSMIFVGYIYCLYVT
eukprot:UN16266